MYFWVKNILKSNSNHTLKYPGNNNCNLVWFIRYILVVYFHFDCYSCICSKTFDFDFGGMDQIPWSFVRGYLSNLAKYNKSETNEFSNWPNMVR